MNDERKHSSKTTFLQRLTCGKYFEADKWAVTAMNLHERFVGFRLQSPNRS